MPFSTSSTAPAISPLARRSSLSSPSSARAELSLRSTMAAGASTVSQAASSSASSRAMPAVLSSVHGGADGTGSMKRRLPTTRKGEPVLAAISVPPLTDDANRHAPSPSHPGRPAAAANAAPTAASANGRLSGRADHLPAQLHRQRREPGAELERPRPEPPHPSRARSYTEPPPGPPPAGPRTRHPPPARSPRRPSRPHPAARPGRTPAAAHGSPGTGRTAAGARRSSGNGPPPGHNASNQTRTPAARRTTGRPGAGPPPPGRPPHKHRPAAGTAIRWPRATHRLDPSPRSAQNEARRDPSRLKRRRQNPGPLRYSQEARSTKSTAGRPAGM